MRCDGRFDHIWTLECLMFLLGVAECGLGLMWDGSTDEEKKTTHRHMDEHVFWGGRSLMPALCICSR